MQMNSEEIFCEVSTQTRFRRYLAVMFVGWISLAASAAFGDTPSGKPLESAPGQRTRAALIGLPLSFEANRGQTDPSVKFFSRGDGYALFLTADSAVFKLRSSGDKSCSRGADEACGS